MNSIESNQEIDVKAINPIMPSDLFKIIQDEIDNILKKICLDYQLDIDTVSKKYNTSSKDKHIQNTHTLSKKYSEDREVFKKNNIGIYNHISVKNLKDYYTSRV